MSALTSEQDLRNFVLGLQAFVSALTNGRNRLGAVCGATRSLMNRLEQAEQARLRTEFEIAEVIRYIGHGERGIPS